MARPRSPQRRPTAAPTPPGPGVAGQLQEVAQLCEELAYYLRLHLAQPTDGRHARVGGVTSMMAYRLLTGLRDHPAMQESFTSYPVAIALRAAVSDVLAEWGLVWEKRRRGDGSVVAGYVLPGGKTGRLVTGETVTRLQLAVDGVRALANTLAGRDGLPGPAGRTPAPPATTNAEVPEGRADTCADDPRTPPPQKERGPRDLQRLKRTARAIRDGAKSGQSQVDSVREFMDVGEKTAQTLLRFYRRHKHRLN